MRLKIVLITSFLAITSCADIPIKDPIMKDPATNIYSENFDKVWRAIQLAVRKYPVRVNTIEAGILETDYVKGDKIFSDPNDLLPKKGLRYKIVVRAVKGKTEGKASVKVTVLKTAEVQPDFFSGFQPISSNGLEEEVIMYRIGRYLEIEKTLAKVK